MEYYSATKMQEILPHVMTLLGLEGIVLGVSQTEKNKSCVISLTCGI